MVCEEYPRSYVVGKNTSEMERTKMERRNIKGEDSKRKTHPKAVFTQAFGVLSFGLPTKLTSLGPPHLSLGQ